jgi:hypothetical protein
VGATIASIVTHAVIAIIAADVMVYQPPRGDAVTEARLAGPVALQTELTSMNPGGSPEPLSVAESPAPTADPAVPDPPADLDIGLESAGELGGGLTGAGSGSGTGSGGGAGDGLEMGGGAGGTASFFGVEARGARFAFIVDTSGSMAGPKVEALRRELTSSIDGLAEQARFAVYFFATETRTLGGSTRWIDAKERNKRWAATEIRAIAPMGGTNPMPAFTSALNMRPRPDAIYFMTDGVFDAAAAPAIAELNRRGRVVPIHCISFVDATARPLMQAIAADSGGTYVHVPGPGGGER